MTSGWSGGCHLYIDGTKCSAIGEEVADFRTQRPIVGTIPVPGEHRVRLKLRNTTKGSEEIVMPLTPRLLSDNMVALKQAASAGLGIVALPGYVCRADVQSGALQRVLPGWLADDSTITALIPYRQGLLPSVRAFIDHIAAEFPKVVLF
jgi:DNA-binding transcriptional LysR family regulator